MKDGIIFANATAKAREADFFTEERLLRMAECTKLSDAVRILVEANYGGGLVVENPMDFPDVLAAERKRVVEFITSVTPENVGFECFYLRNDYHNVKAILKAKYSSGSTDGMLLEGGLIPISVLKEKLERDDISINPYIDEAVKEIRKAFMTARSPRLIDTLIDKAMYRDIEARMSSRGVDAYIKEYFATYIDCVNIGSFVRSARINGSDKFFLTNYVVGGTLSEKWFLETYPNVSALKERLKATRYAAFSEKIEEGGITEFDTARDNYLLNIFRANKSDMFSVAPIMGYYLAKENEIKTLRIALVCIKNGVSKAELKKRLRCMYA